MVWYDMIGMYLGSKHVVEDKVSHIEDTKHSRPAQIGSNQLSSHSISKVVDNAQRIQLTRHTNQHCSKVT